MIFKHVFNKVFIKMQIHVVFLFRPKNYREHSQNDILRTGFVTRSAGFQADI